MVYLNSAVPVSAAVAMTLKPRALRDGHKEETEFVQFFGGSGLSGNK